MLHQPVDLLLVLLVGVLESRVVEERRVEPRRPQRLLRRLAGGGPPPEAGEAGLPGGQALLQLLPAGRPAQAQAAADLVRRLGRLQMETGPSCCYLVR